jgi:hypothetical protein
MGRRCGRGHNGQHAIAAVKRAGLQIAGANPARPTHCPDNLEGWGCRDILRALGEAAHSWRSRCGFQAASIGTPQTRRDSRERPAHTIQPHPARGRRLETRLSLSLQPGDWPSPGRTLITGIADKAGGGKRSAPLGGRARSVKRSHRIDPTVSRRQAGQCNRQHGAIHPCVLACRLIQRRSITRTELQVSRTG